MRAGTIKAKAAELANLAAIHTGKRISANAFLPPQLRELPPPKTADDYDRQSRAMGITKTENF